MSEGLNVMEEEEFNAMGNEGFDEEGVEDTLAEEDAIAIAKLDAITEELKMDALAEERMIEEDAKEEKERLMTKKILEEEKEKLINKEKQDLDEKLKKHVMGGHRIH